MSDIDKEIFEFFHIDTHPAPRSITNELNDITESKIDYRNANRCEFCYKALKRRFRVHKNIYQDPQEHKFCSRECKEKWCYEKQGK